MSQRKPLRLSEVTSNPEEPAVETRRHFANPKQGVEGLSTMTGVEVYGITDLTQVHSRVPTFTFNIADANPLKVAKYLWEKHAIAVLAENHGGFYSRTLKTYGKSIAVRASPVHFNTIEEIGMFLHAVKDAVRHFRS